MLTGRPSGGSGRPATALTLVAALALAAAAGGCGGDPVATATTPPAPALSSRVAQSGTIPRPRARDFAGPIATYKRHVASELSSMAGWVEDLRRAADVGDLNAARRAWLRADQAYESIGAAYGAFGSLDAAINRGAGNLPGGPGSSQFTGLHRVELALWERRSTTDAAEPAAQLARDVGRLRAHVPAAKVEPLDYALRAHEVLEDALHLPLAGARNQWSGAALDALAGNVAGTRVVFDSLEPMIRRRDPVAARQSAAALEALGAALAELHTGSSYPSWSTLSQRERERISGLTAAAAERLASVPTLIDPRPPRPPQSAFGQEVSR